MAVGKTISNGIEGDAQLMVSILQMIEYHRQGRFIVGKIMKIYAFEDINRAYEGSASGKYIKVVVQMKK